MPVLRNCAIAALLKSTRASGLSPLGRARILLAQLLASEPLNGTFCVNTGRHFDRVISRPFRADIEPIVDLFSLG